MREVLTTLINSDVADDTGAGAGTQIMTRASTKIPSESVMDFRLAASLTL